MKIKTGFGYDIHRLKEGEYFLLAGVKIKGDYAIDAHSDGDIIFHSLANSILSSLGKEDIGYYFPDDKKATSKMSSRKIVEFALDLLNKSGYRISNVVVDIILEKPKLKDYREEIKKSLVSLLNLDDDSVSIQFNTHERVDSIGRSEAIVVISNILIYKD